MCKTHKVTIHDSKGPKFEIHNELIFTKQSPKLKLHAVEERLVALMILFIQLQNLPYERQKLVHIYIVNVPTHVPQ